MKYFLSYMIVAVIVTLLVFVTSDKNREDKISSTFAGVVWPVSVLVIGFWFAVSTAIKLCTQYQARRRMKIRKGKCKAKELQLFNEWMLTVSKDIYPYDATTEVIKQYRKLYLK